MQRILQSHMANGVVVIVLLLAMGSGCTATKQNPSKLPPAVPPSQSSVESSAAPQAGSSPAKAQPDPTDPVETPAAEGPPVKTSTAQKSTSQPPVKTQPAKEPATIAQAPTKNSEKPIAPKPVTPPTNSATVAPPPTPATPTLDLRSLEQRLRDTDAIGIMTKLSLKNQVDDLLDDFRDYYAGKAKTALTDLRQRYDLLLMKVLTLLQDDDVALASAISSSREAIWGILRDPKKFAEI